MNAYAQRAQGAPLADLPAEKRDLVLKAIDENTAEGLPQGRQFFNRARRLTLEGMFGDPYYGGNGAFAGWDLIRYPGPRPAVDAQMQAMDACSLLTTTLLGEREYIMATTLKPVDVAVIGLGAAGGIAVLPLARAGLKIAGIEAGTWMDPHRDFHADEIFNNVRRQVTTSPKAQREIPPCARGREKKLAHRQRIP